MGEQKNKPRSPRRKALEWGIQAVVLLVALWGITKFQARNLLDTNSPAPGFSLKAIDGSVHTLSEAKGRPTVLYFFAPWCSVCRFSSDNIADLRKSRPEDQVAIYAIGLSWESPDEVKAFAAEHGLSSVPVLLGNGATARAYQVNTFPSIYILNPDGTIKDRLVGYTTELGLKLRL